MVEKLRFGIIGCGRVAPRHAQSIQQLDNTELIAIADIREDRAENFHSKYGAEPYTDYQDMLARDDIDVICVCTPSGLHAQHGMDVAKAGKHIIVEKPIALSTIDADTLVQTAEEAGVKLCVILQN